MKKIWPFYLNDTFFSPDSKGATDYNQQNLTDMYDYDFNSTCDQDLDAAGSTIVLYYVLFGLGLIGMNIITFVANAYMLYTLLHRSYIFQELFFFLLWLFVYFYGVFSHRKRNSSLASPPIHKAKDNDGRVPAQPGAVWPHPSSHPPSLGIQHPQPCLV